MNALKADAKSVRLRELGGGGGAGGYWYSVLCRVLELFEEDEWVGVGGEVSFGGFFILFLLFGPPFFPPKKLWGSVGCKGGRGL